MARKGGDERSEREQFEASRDAEPLVVPVEALQAAEAEVERLRTEADDAREERQSFKAARDAAEAKAADLIQKKRTAAEWRDRFKAERDAAVKAVKALRELVQLEGDLDVPYHNARFTQAWVDARSALADIEKQPKEGQ